MTLTKKPNQNKKVLTRIKIKVDPNTPLVEMQIGRAIMENDMVIPPKI